MPGNGEQISPPAKTNDDFSTGMLEHAWRQHKATRRADSMNNENIFNIGHGNATRTSAPLRQNQQLFAQHDEVTDDTLKEHGRSQGNHY